MFLGVGDIWTDLREVDRREQGGEGKEGNSNKQCREDSYTIYMAISL